MRFFCVLLTSAVIALMPATSQAGIGPELDRTASFGVSMGAMRWLADKGAREWQEHPAQVRPIGKAVFRYRMNSTWLMSVETGFGWNSYAESDDLVTWVIPTTIGLERRFGELWGATTYFDFGAGFYVWAQRRGGHFIKDPVTNKDLHGIDPGVYAGVSGETHLTGHVTLTVHSTLHFMYETNSDDFPSGFGGNDLFIDLRAGLNYYFSPYEGLIWGGSE